MKLLNNEMTDKEVVDTFFERTDEFGTPILISMVGSNAYNVATETSDKDYRGVFIPNEKHLLGLHRVKQVSIKNEDWVCQEVRHFIEIVIKQNPTIIELLYIQDSIFKTQLWDILSVELKKLITKEAFKPYNAYFLSQVTKAQLRQFQENSKRYGNIEKYGYDPKFMSHAVRLGLQCCALMSTGSIPVRLEGEDRLVVLNIKQGGMPLAEVKEYCNTLNETMHYHYKNSVLPEHQDLNKFEEEFYIPFMKQLVNK